MTDRLKGFTVILEQDMRDDDAEAIKQAILALRLVQDVKPIGALPDDYFARSRVRHELWKKVMDVFEEGE